MKLSQKQIILLISASLIAATLVAYEPIRHNGFVYYDDSRYITDNPLIKSGITWQSLSQVFKPHYFMWHPLTTFTNMLDCELFGLNPFWHHLVSLLIHITNALLLFWILKIMTGSTSSPQAGSIWASAFVAAVFALHPLQVESVAWVSERKTVLSGLLWFLTTAVYIWYTKKPGFGRYIPLFVMYAFCIMTKPSVVTLPLALLLLDYWPLGRFDGLKPILRVKRLFIEKIPLLALSAVLGVLTVIAQKGGGTVATLANVSIEYRIFNMFFSYIRYIGKMVWPSALAVIYPLPDSIYLKSIVVVCVLVFIVISIFCIYIGLRRKYVMTGWLWYVGTLVPMIGLVQVGSQAMANRYMYISMLGLLIIIAWAVKELTASQRRLQTAASALAVVMLLTCVILTRKQVSYWQNDKQLSEYALKVTENNYIAENGLGFVLTNEGRYTEAISHLSKAVQINPVYSDARNNLGVAFLRQGKLNEAIACFNELIKRKEATASVYNNLAAAMGLQKRYDDAIQYLEMVLKLDPKYPEAHKRMGEVMVAAGRMNEAIEQLNEALRTDSNSAEIYVSLGRAYKQLGKYEAAIQSWTKAVELEPNNANVLNNVAWLLATLGETSAADADKAIEFARRACELSGYKESPSLDTLAAAYAAAGRFTDAKATAEKALNIAKDTNQEELARKIESRLKLYEAGLPYRQK
jgi:tetratricopeptide (TPR) repeat protein